MTALGRGGEGLSLFENASSQQLLRLHLKQVALTLVQKLGHSPPSSLLPSAFPAPHFPWPCLSGPQQLQS